MSRMSRNVSRNVGAGAGGAAVIILALSEVLAYVGALLLVNLIFKPIFGTRIGRQVFIILASLFYASIVFLDQGFYNTKFNNVNTLLYNEILSITLLFGIFNLILAQRLVGLLNPDVIWAGSSNYRGSLNAIIFLPIIGFALYAFLPGGWGTAVLMFFLFVEYAFLINLQTGVNKDAVYLNPNIVSSLDGAQARTFLRVRSIGKYVNIIMSISIVTYVIYQKRESLKQFVFFITDKLQIISDYLY